MTALEAVDPFSGARRIEIGRFLMSHLGAGGSHDLVVQRPFQIGSRFSAKAAIPSAASSEPAVRLSIAWR